MASRGTTHARFNNLFAQPIRGQMRTSSNDTAQSFFSELFVFTVEGLGHTICVCDEHVPALRPNRLLLVGAVVEETYD